MSVKKYEKFSIIVTDYINRCLEIKHARINHSSVDSYIELLDYEINKMVYEAYQRGVNDTRKAITDALGL